MRFESQTKTASGQLTTSTQRARSIEFHARSDNDQSVVVGESDVSATNGRELPPGESVSFNFDEGSEPLNTFYAYMGKATDKLDWTAILRD